MVKVGLRFGENPGQGIVKIGSSLGQGQIQYQVVGSKSSQGQSQGRVRSKLCKGEVKVKISIKVWVKKG